MGFVHATCIDARAFKCVRALCSFTQPAYSLHREANRTAAPERGFTKVALLLANKCNLKLPLRTFQNGHLQ